MMIVVRCPKKQFQLSFGQDRFLVQHLLGVSQLFAVRAGWVGDVEQQSDCMPASQRHSQTHARMQGARVNSLWWQVIEAVRDRGRHGQAQNRRWVHGMVKLRQLTASVSHAGLRQIYTAHYLVELSLYR